MTGYDNTQFLVTETQETAIKVDWNEQVASTDHDERLCWSQVTETTGTQYYHSVTYAHQRRL